MHLLLSNYAEDLTKSGLLVLLGFEVVLTYFVSFQQMQENYCITDLVNGLYEATKGILPEEQNMDSITLRYLTLHLKVIITFRVIRL